MCRATDDSRKLRYRRYFDVVYSSCWCRVHGILNESRSLPAFFFPPSTVDVSHMSTLPTVFWKQSHVCPWTRIYEQPRSFQAYIARAGAWPFLSPFLPFAATVDRFFFFAARHSTERNKECRTLTSTGVKRYTRLFIALCQYLCQNYIFVFIIRITKLVLVTDHVYISILFLHLHLITFTKESLVGIPYRKF